MRRVLAVLASIGLGIGTIALASPAQAAANPSTLYVGCTTASPGELIFSTDESGGTQFAQMEIITGSAGDSLTVIYSNNSAMNNCVTDVTVQYGSVSEDLAKGEQTVLTLLASAFSLEVSAEVTTPGQPQLENESRIVDVSGGGGSDSGSSGSPGSAPASEIQQFGLPASGNCEDGATEAMNWSGIGMDGWGISWAQWMNEGAGGPVCTRTVVYDTSTAKWVVN